MLDAADENVAPRCEPIMRRLRGDNLPRTLPLAANAAMCDPRLPRQHKETAGSHRRVQSQSDVETVGAQAS